MVFITKLQYPQHLRLKNKKKKKKKFFPTCITVSSFFRLTALSMRLVFLFYAQDIYSSHNVRCINTHIVCYSADGCEHLKVIPLYPQVGWERKATTDQIRGTNSRIMDRNVLCAFSCLRCSFFCFLFPTSKWVIDPLSAWALILLFYDFLFFYRLPREASFSIKIELDSIYLQCGCSSPSVLLFIMCIDAIESDPSSSTASYSLDMNSLFVF